LTPPCRTLEHPQTCQSFIHVIFWIGNCNKSCTQASMCNQTPYGAIPPTRGHTGGRPRSGDGRPAWPSGSTGRRGPGTALCPTRRPVHSPPPARGEAAKKAEWFRIDDRSRMLCLSNWHLHGCVASMTFMCGMNPRSHELKPLLWV